MTKAIVSTSMFALLVSAALVAPFMVLEWVNRTPVSPEFPIALFVFMSLHASLMVFALTPALRRFRIERTIAGLNPRHWGGLVVAVVLAVLYVFAVVDQWPCFLGAPNCD